jgi:hypothetical protein
MHCRGADIKHHGREATTEALEDCDVSGRVVAACSPQHRVYRISCRSCSRTGGVEGTSLSSRDQPYISAENHRYTGE